MTVGEGMSRSVITLTTDFGTVDSYVAAMKGVILSICPEATLVDVCHEVEPQAIKQAAYLLSTTVPYFPPGSIHLVVVDPGVGSERWPIAVRTGRAIYVAPDNGVLSLVLHREPSQLAVRLTDPAYHLSEVSATFHGRDIFAPAAAHLARGTDPTQMGHQFPPSELITSLMPSPLPQANGSWQGEVLHIDHFGNLITNFEIPNSHSRLAVTVGEQRVEPLRHTFADVEPGQMLIYRGSSGYLEIAVREGNAAAELGVRVSDPVLVESLP
jgi:S-adenosylmethionine hydrolase